jgi:hypothetical protein
MKIYLLYYDHDYGDRENWNTFYTPVEVFDSKEKRQARIDFIKQQVDEDGEPVDYEFHEVDTVLMTDAMAQEWADGS